MDDIKLALDKAAASPDPAVRGMALHYTEARNRLAALEAFFAFYAEGAVTVNGKVSAPRLMEKPVAAPAAPAKPRVAPEKKSVGSNAKAEEFTRDILDILRQSDKPVKLPDLQMIYEAMGKEPPLQPEAFRQRMIKRKNDGVIGFIPHVGYWPPPSPEVKSDA
jgi:hypothetical protein